MPVISLFLLLAQICVSVKQKVIYTLINLITNFIAHFKVNGILIYKRTQFNTKKQNKTK